MDIGMIDLISLAVFIFSVLFALYSGLIRELFSISSWILAGFAAVYSYAPLQPIMGRIIHNPKLAGLCGSVAVALIILIVMTIIGSRVNKRLRQSSLSGLDRLLGMIFGAVRALFLMVLVYVGLTKAVSEDRMKAYEKNNYSIGILQKTASFLVHFVPQNVQKDLNLEQTVATAQTKKIGTTLEHTHKLPEKSNQKAVKNLIRDVKSDSGKPAVKASPKEKSTEQPVEQKPAVVKEVPQYNLNEREALDKMVETLVQKEDKQ